MNRMVLGAWLLGIALFPAQSRESAAQTVDFHRQILPILADNCFKCHGPNAQDRQADLRLDTPPDHSSRPIVPGHPDVSALYRRIISTDPDERMPPPEADRRLDSRQIELIKDWIEQGGQWQTHWAYSPPQRPDIPNVSGRNWTLGPIDRFTLGRMEHRKLDPSDPAPRWQWLRRATLDLTGLAPALDQLSAFESDSAPDAHHRAIDRLLASVRYGERMALPWLDAARYADTHGFHADAHRDMWRWREWVIDALNENLSFDKFTVWQVAGDLLHEATLEQRIATGFNRNHMINFENGAISEEYRVQYVADRVDTTSTVWLGQTMQCARCHDHKYDPISQIDYFRMFAYFNNIRENGLDGKQGNAEPWIAAPTRQQQRRLDDLMQRANAVRRQMTKYAREAEPARLVWEQQLRSGATSLEKLATRPVAHYRLDERQGMVAHDASGSELHGEVQGHALWLPDSGKFGGTLAFSDQTYIDCGDAGNFRRRDSFSCGAWIFPTTGGEMTVLARTDPQDTDRGFELKLEHGQLCARLVHEGDSRAIEVVARPMIAQNEWHHVMMTYDGSSTAQGVTIYINGQKQEVEVRQDRLGGEITVDYPLQIGRNSTRSPFRGLIDEVRLYASQLGPIEVALLAGRNPIDEIVRRRKDQRSATEQDLLERYYLQHVDNTYREYQVQLHRLDQLREAVEREVSTTMVMEELVENRRPTHLLARGDYRSPAARVEPGTPAYLPSIDSRVDSTRLDLAHWLVSPTNPLMARVTVNRYWQLFFGTGIVRTTEDFGTRGAPPSHPALLDWLATEFVRGDWNVKRLQREIILSATYRQSSRIPNRLAEIDPHNELLARGPRFRLPAEHIRDNALRSAGLLHERVGGKSVFPYQPAGLWREVSYDPRDYSAQIYVQGSGSDLYRRSLYTFWKRSVPPAALSTMGAPDREVCSTQRTPTSTPLDALVLMNDPTYVEAARGLAQRMLNAGELSARQRISMGFRMVTSRRPSTKELKVLDEIRLAQERRFSARPSLAKALVAVGDSEPDSRLNDVPLATFTVLASVLLNLHETMTRG